MDVSLVDDEGIDGLLQASPVFGQLSADARRLVRDALVVRVVHNGEVLMRQGDPADGLISSGADVSRSSSKGRAPARRSSTRSVAANSWARWRCSRITRGPPPSPRYARVSCSSFQATRSRRVVQAYPEALRRISSALISKLMHTIRYGSTATPATSVVIVPLDDSAPVRELGDRLARSLEPLVGLVPVVRADDMPAELGEASQLRRAAWREHLEAANGAVVYIADPTFDRWTSECIANSDLVVLAAAAEDRASHASRGRTATASRLGRSAFRTRPPARARNEHAAGRGAGSVPVG